MREVKFTGLCKGSERFGWFILFEHERDKTSFFNVDGLAEVAGMETE
jgi:hypothetical protein